MSEKGASFSDSIIAALSKDAEVLGSIVKEPVWDDERQVLLVQIEPKDQNRARELGEKAVELLRGVTGDRFKAQIQTLNVDARTNYIFKISLL